MNNEQAVLITLLSNTLFKHNHSVLLDEHGWEAVMIESVQQAVPLLAYEAARSRNADSQVLDSWQKNAMTVVANNVRINHGHARVHEWMSEAGIPYVILKGCASAAYYPEPLLRSMGDIDFYVRCDDLDRAGKVLEAHGFRPWNKEHISHIVYHGDGIPLEMHFNVPGMPDGRAGEIIQGCLDSIFDEATAHDVGSGKAMLPSPFHHGLIILLHTYHHLTGEGIGLRHLCDWAVFANSFSDEEFRNMFERPLKGLGLWRFAQVLTRISIKYLGAGAREWVGAPEPVDDQLLEDIVSGGNFGQKDGSRRVETVLISNRGKHGVGGLSMPRQLVSSMNEIVRTNVPVTRSHPVLLPAGWLYIAGRTIWRLATGRRKMIDPVRMVGNASKRRDVYSQLRLYEPER